MEKLLELLEKDPFDINYNEKLEIYVEYLKELTDYHSYNCEEYRKILSILDYSKENTSKLEDIPFIPVRLFKEMELKSISADKILKTMTSSGTTGQKVSKIFLDRETSINQTKVLTKILSSYLGNKRLPMLIIDSSSVLKDRKLFSARGAGIIGFSMVGYDVTYALDEQMNLDLEKINIFLEKHRNEKILVFGFTFMIWEYFFMELKKRNMTLNVENGIMIHGGGWKKLIDKAVDNEKFKKEINSVTNIEKIYNYYGMVEQTGSIFMECECGFLHSSVFSDIIIRDSLNFNSLESKWKGIVQLVSLLPVSYPGHSILTEDEGEIIGIDDCKCGRKGKYFKIHGRIKDAEIRGCSDTYASK